jgi:hypothetical protein
MGRKRAKIDVEKRRKQGAGKGHGNDYTPWLPVQGSGSHGYVSRVPGWKTGREHHVLSNLELDYFHLLDLATRVVDIREQYPLFPIDETIAIASSLGFPYPTYPKTNQPVVLTTDFLITVRGEPRDVDEARTIKPANELLSSRIIQKFQIEQIYWKARNISWAIVTDLDIPRNMARNLAWLHPHFKLPASLKLPEGCPDKVDMLLRESMARGVGLAAASQACDDKLGLEPGTSLGLARHFIACRRWKVNLNEAIKPSLPIQLLDNSA